MSDMGNIKTTHLGGDSARKPSVAPGAHPMQRPGNADKSPASKMEWKEKGMNATGAPARKHKGE